MAIYTFRVGPYARSIYLDGTKVFAQAEAEDTRYTQAIKEYAAKNFTYPQIDEALANGYITQQVYDDTIAIKALTTPRPTATTAETTDATV